MQQDAPQLRFGTAQLASGLQIHYAEQGDPGGEPILFLHGYTDSWFSFSRLLPLLPDHYRALALDQRGHGDSERPDDRYTFDDFAADVLCSWTPSGSSARPWSATLRGASSLAGWPRSTPSGYLGWC